MTFQPKVWVWMEDGTIYRLIIGIYVSPLPQQKLGVWTVPENQSEAYWPLKNEKLKQTIENCVKDSFYGYSSKCISDSKEMLKWWLMAYKLRKIEEKLKNAWFKWGEQAFRFVTLNHPSMASLNSRNLPATVCTFSPYKTQVQLVH